MDNKFAVYLSPLGYVRIEHENKTLTSLKILESEPKTLGKSDNFTDKIFSQIIEYIKGERQIFDVEISLENCTDFQKKVLSELRNIPYGETRSYKQIAELIGEPKAARAVGTANNRNPIHIIIPCHRVIGSRGELTGYAAGLETKDFLLRLEKNKGNY